MIHSDIFFPELNADAFCWSICYCTDQCYSGVKHLYNLKQPAALHVSQSPFLCLEKGNDKMFYSLYALAIFTLIMCDTIAV